MSLREKIFSTDDITRETVEVPEWGVKLELRAPSSKVRTALIKQFMDEEGNLDLVSMFPTLLVTVCFDPETNEQVFSYDDVEPLLEKNGAVIERLGKRALELVGILEGAVEEGKDDSSETPADDTSSD